MLSSELCNPPWSLLTVSLYMHHGYFATIKCAFFPDGCICRHCFKNLFVTCQLWFLVFHCFIHTVPFISHIIPTCSLDLHHNAFFTVSYVQYGNLLILHIPLILMTVITLILSITIHMKNLHIGVNTSRNMLPGCSAAQAQHLAKKSMRAQFYTPCTCLLSQ